MPTNEIVAYILIGIVAVSLAIAFLLLWREDKRHKEIRKKMAEDNAATDKSIAHMSEMNHQMRMDMIRRNREY